ncbi:MAG: aminotransferase class I/II-fold pyridoxal phosphate-dependent enzyme [Pirellulales bacterium]
MSASPARFPRESLVWPLPDDDIALILQAMLSDGAWGRYEGEYGERCCAALRDWSGLPHVLLCSSGTIAVEIALRGLGVRPGDEVAVAAYDFPGNFRAIEAVGARPVVVDIEPSSWSLDPQQLEEALGPATRAAIFSHLHGRLAAAATLREVADRRGIGLVEDICQVPGAVVDGRRAGTWGDVSVLSFGGSKLLTAGRGGAVLTARQDVFQRGKIFGERGNQAFPLSELQAAVLLPQLARLEQRNELRRQRVARLLAALAGGAGLESLPGRGTAASGDLAEQQPVYYKVGWRVTLAGAGSRELLIARSQAAGVPLDSGFRGFTGRSTRRCRSVGTLPHARRAASQTVLLHHPVLLQSEAVIDQLAAVLCSVLSSLTSELGAGAESAGGGGDTSTTGSAGEEAS